MLAERIAPENLSAGQTDSMTHATSTHATSLSPRNILCVFPRYEPSFGTFEHAYHLTDKTKAFMPPQGLLTIAAALPAHWPVRFIDENMAPATAADFAWADAVFASGMHIQRRNIESICARAHAAGKVAALGGPSVSSCPENYPGFDYLHVGEMGDATDALIACLGDSVARPASQVVLKTQDPPGAVRFPDAGLRAGRDRPLHARHRAVLVRLPLQMRVLRHPPVSTAACRA